MQPKHILKAEVHDSLEGPHFGPIIDTRDLAVTDHLSFLLEEYEAGHSAPPCFERPAVAEINASEMLVPLGGFEVARSAFSKGHFIQCDLYSHKYFVEDLAEGVRQAVEHTQPERCLENDLIWGVAKSTTLDDWDLAKMFGTSLRLIQTMLRLAKAFKTADISTPQRWQETLHLVETKYPHLWDSDLDRIHKSHWLL